MKRFLIFATLSLVAAASQAQRINVDVPQSVVANAIESVDVTLDGPMLRIASAFLSDKDEERNVRDMICKLQGIYVRTYRFDRDGAYDRSVVERVRGQLGAKWQRIVTVQSRTNRNAEIYVDTNGDAIAGLVIISAEPRELTLVNIVGPIDLEKLASLEGQFGIPHVSGKEKRP